MWHVATVSLNVSFLIIDSLGFDLFYFFPFLLNSIFLYPYFYHLMCMFGHTGILSGTVSDDPQDAVVRIGEYQLVLLVKA